MSAMPGFGHDNVSHYSTNSAAFRSFTCGHCGTHVSGALIATAAAPGGSASIDWLRCSRCGEPCVIDASGQVHPGTLGGLAVDGLPGEVSATYREARQCLGVRAYNACELVCRKILMHLAVDKAGGKPGDTFSNYITALESSGYITPPMKGWVDLIRQHANKSAHALPAPSADRAEATLMFTGELLRIAYEMEHLASKYRPALADGETTQ